MKCSKCGAYHVPEKYPLTEYTLPDNTHGLLCIRCASQHGLCIWCGEFFGDSVERDHIAKNLVCTGCLGLIMDASAALAALEAEHDEFLPGSVCPECGGIGAWYIGEITEDDESPYHLIECATCGHTYQEA